jgi:ferritin
MISDKMRDALNAQIAKEGNASFLYLSMAAWCDIQGLEGCGKFFYKQSAEEHDHMMRMFNYMLEMDSEPRVPGIPQPKDSFGSIQVLFEEVFQHEKMVTASINDLVNIAIDEQDHTTHNFLQWYVMEQREEEATIRNILDKLRLIGDGPQSLYYIDKEVDSLNVPDAPA